MQNKSFHSKKFEKFVFLYSANYSNEEKHIQIFGIFLVLFGFILVAWLYLAAPQTLADVPAKARETVENVTTKGQILTGTYEIDQTKFKDGLNAFRADNFIVARDDFAKADSEQRDAKTQFYLAYCFYRQVGAERIMMTRFLNKVWSKSIGLLRSIRISKPKTII